MPGSCYGSLQHNQSVNDRNWGKKSLFKRDFENQHYGGPTFTDPLHCWALFISPASGHLSFISHHDPVSPQSRCAQRLRAAAVKQDFISHFFRRMRGSACHGLSREHVGYTCTPIYTTCTCLAAKLGQMTVNWWYSMLMQTCSLVHD